MTFFTYLELSFFVVLINPLGWHMFLHMAPFYLPFLVREFSCLYKGMKKPVLCFFCFFVYSLLSFAFVSHGPGSVDKLIRYFYELLVFWLFLNCDISLKRLQLLIKFYIYSCGAVVLKMIVQHVRMPVEEVRYTIDNFGKLMDPNFLTALFVLPSLVLFYKIVNQTANKRIYFLLSCFLVAVFATGSRGGLLSTLIGFAILFIKIKSKKTKIFLIFCAVSIFILLTVYEADKMSRFSTENLEDGSNLLRFHLWDVAFQIFQSSPLIGRGANSMINLGPDFGVRINIMAHNTYLEMLADYGIIGFTLWILPFIILIKRAFKRKNFLVISISASSFFCAFFISAQDSAFWWQNVILSYLMLRYNVNDMTSFKLFEKNGEKIAA